MGRTTILSKIATFILTGGRRTTASGTRDVLTEMANSYVSAIYDTSANFTSSNPVLETKQIGVETNTLKFKIGDGTTAWNSLSYVGQLNLQQVTDNGLDTTNVMNFNGATDGLVKVKITPQDGVGGGVEVYDAVGDAIITSNVAYYEVKDITKLLSLLLVDRNNTTVTIGGDTTINLNKNLNLSSEPGNDTGYYLYNDVGIPVALICVNASSAGQLILYSSLGSGTIRLNGETGSIIKNGIEVATVDDINTSTIGAVVNGASAATPNNTDLVATVESSVVKKITWTNVKAFLKTYFDTIYVSLTNQRVSSFFQHASTTLNDSTSYFVCSLPIAPSTSTNVVRRISAPITGKLAEVEYHAVAGTTPSSAQDISLNVNNKTAGTSVTVGNIRYDNSVGTYFFTGLSLAVTQNDSLEIELVVPVLTTNPAGCFCSGNLFFKP